MIIVCLAQCTSRAAFYQISCKAINNAALWLVAVIIKPFMAGDVIILDAGMLM
jgi:hypothetical protein